MQRYESVADTVHNVLMTISYLNEDAIVKTELQERPNFIAVSRISEWCQCPILYAKPSEPRTNKTYAYQFCFLLNAKINSY